MKARLYRYAAMLLGVLLTLGLVAWWGYGNGEAVQAGRDAALIAKKNAALLAASGSLSNAAAALRDVSAQTLANQAAAAQGRAKAAAASATAAKAKQDLIAAQADWEHRFANARRQPDCRAVLEMHLCPAVSE